MDQWIIIDELNDFNVMCESFCSCMISSRSCKSRASSPCPSGSAASVCWPCQWWLPLPSKWNYSIPGSALQNGSRKTHRKESMRSGPCWPKRTAQPQLWGYFLRGLACDYSHEMTAWVSKENQEFITCIRISFCLENSRESSLMHCATFNSGIVSKVAVDSRIEIYRD